MRRVSLFGCCVMAGAMAQSALAVPEVESNDSFADRQILSSGESTLEGGLEDVFASFDESRAGVLTEGVVDSWNFTAAPGTSFTAWIDNHTADPFERDTVLGEFDPQGTLVRSNDDASPLGNGFASAVVGNANADGSIRLKVTGFPDYDFDGQDDFEPEFPHFQTGAYTLFVRIGVVPDVDYVSFTGLPPGVFEAEIVSAEFDTVMGRLDDAGAIVDFNDDLEEGFLLSGLTGDVPPSGEIHLAISSFEDLNLDGLQEDDVEPFELFGFYGVGSYTLVVPEPSSPWLAASALAATLALTRRRGRRDILR